jgi:hypothetical protein
MSARAALAAIAAPWLSGVPAGAQAPPPGPSTLFENVRVFDGKGGALSGPLNVLVEGGIIAEIAADPIPRAAGGGVASPFSPAVAAQAWMAGTSPAMTSADMRSDRLGGGDRSPDAPRRRERRATSPHGHPGLDPWGGGVAILTAGRRSSARHPAAASIRNSMLPVIEY